MQIEIPCSSIDEITRVIRRQSIELSKERYFFAGPCGIGKTTLGKLLSKKLGLNFIDHDEMKDKIKLNPNPCSLSYLNLDDCFRASLTVEGNPNTFIFSVGGDSIFRSNANNDERLTHLLQARRKYGFVVVVLTAERAILEHRFLKISTRNNEEFLGIWRNWNNIEKPYWERCADCIIETSKLTL
jgi:hypothetical protein